MLCKKIVAIPVSMTTSQKRSNWNCSFNFTLYFTKYFIHIQFISISNFRARTRTLHFIYLLSCAELLGLVTLQLWGKLPPKAFNYHKRVTQKKFIIVQLFWYAVSAKLNCFERFWTYYWSLTKMANDPQTISINLHPSPLQFAAP